MTSTQNDFVIDQVSWHTRTEGNPESREQIEKRFRVLFGFLAKHQLLSKSAAPDFGLDTPIEENTSVRASHLTPAFSIRACLLSVAIQPRLTLEVRGRLEAARRKTVPLDRRVRAKTSKWFIHHARPLESAEGALFFHG